MHLTNIHEREGALASAVHGRAARRGPGPKRLVPLAVVVCHVERRSRLHFPKATLNSAPWPPRLGDTGLSSPPRIRMGIWFRFRRVRILLGEDKYALYPKVQIPLFQRTFIKTKCLSATARSLLFRSRRNHVTWPFHINLSMLAGRLCDPRTDFVSGFTVY